MPTPIQLRIEVEDLYTAYAEALDDGNIEAWPEFFVEDCFYLVIPNENYSRGLPLATIRCESKGMLKDRVVAVRETMAFEPRTLRHLVSNFRVRANGDDGATPFEVIANYAVFESLVDEPARVFNTGRYVDKLIRRDGVLKFQQKFCVFDSALVPNSIVYPI